MCSEQWNETIQFGPKCYLLAAELGKSVIIFKISKSIESENIQYF